VVGGVGFLHLNPGECVSDTFSVSKKWSPMIPQAQRLAKTAGSPYRWV